MITNPKWKLWIEARKRHHLSHKHVQMAIALGMNPKKLGKLDNHRQEAWKAPLPEFIERCYFKSFKREKPKQIQTVEEMIKLEIKKKLLKKAKKKEKQQPNNQDRQEDASNRTPDNEGISQ